MRDIFVITVVMGSLPFILQRPWIGILVWSWLGYMNPHRLAWGFATDFPFAMIVGLVTMFSMLMSREQKRIPWTRESILLLIFVLWMVITTITAVRPELAVLQLEKVVKIQLMTFVTLMLMNTRLRIDCLVWIIALSLGFYGVKGGIFTMVTGGSYNVMGPPSTFIGGNNEIGLALIMTVPLIRYLYLSATKKWVRWGLISAMVLTFIAILGTQSRGAFVGGSAMLVFLAMKSRRRVAFLLFFSILIPTGLLLMPQSWYDRMGTIEHYEQDSSAQGRLDAWRYAINTARERPLVGGGFGIFAGRRDAHSIYFEVLGEQGYVGLTMFLLLGFFTWRSGSWIIRHSRDLPELQWANDLARMVQVSMVGYAASGAFLGLAYFDFYYHLVAIMILARIFVAHRLAVEKPMSSSQSVRSPVYQ